MDLNLLDDDFPITILDELKNNVFPEMKKKYDELETLITSHASGIEDLKTTILDKINDCKTLVNTMQDLGKKFGEHRGYQSYRRQNPNRIYFDHE